MGSLKLPASGRVYFDANAVIYSVEKIQPYLGLLQDVWDAAESGQIVIVSSELLLLEVLVKPLRDADALLQGIYRELLLESDEVELIPMQLPIIEHATRIRAAANLKAPDAIHAATALETSASLFITNDPGFTRVAALPVVVLSELLAGRVAAPRQATADSLPPSTPMPFPVREMSGHGWQVLVLPEDNWLPCESQEDAQAIAAAPVLEYQSLERTRSGSEFAAELERTAAALAKYGIGFGSRFFQRRADEARNRR